MFFTSELKALKDAPKSTALVRYYMIMSSESIGRTWNEVLFVKGLASVTSTPSPNSSNRFIALLSNPPKSPFDSSFLSLDVVFLVIHWIHFLPYDLG